MTDIEQTISDKSNIGNPELQTADPAADQLELTKSKNDLFTKSSGFDALKITSDTSNIPTDFQMTDSTSNKKGNQRLIIAEDPEWNLAAVESLSFLALKSIVKTFQGMIINHIKI